MMSNISDCTEHVHTYILVVWVDLASKKVLFLRTRPRAPYNGNPIDGRDAKIEKGEGVRSTQNNTFFEAKSTQTTLVCTHLLDLRDHPQYCLTYCQHVSQNTCSSKRFSRRNTSNIFQKVRAFMGAQFLKRSYSAPCNGNPRGLCECAIL